MEVMNRTSVKFQGLSGCALSHSLGVAYLADRGFERFSKESRFGDSKELHLAFTIAALIHDIGHGPYGHTMDLVRRYLGDLDGHEDDTGRIFNQIFDKKTSFADLDLALNSVPVARDVLQEILAGEHPLGKVLSNSGCDIDRLDFVMRDSAVTLASVADKKSQDRRDLDLLVGNYVQLLHGIHFIESGGTISLCFQNRLRPSLQAFARLYCKLYNKVYYGWQNTAARLMLASAVVEMVHSQKVEFSDLKPLTDIELLATLEDFEHPRVRELAHLVKYRRLFGVIKDKEIADADESEMFALQTDEEAVRKFGGIDYAEGMLVARLPSKRVKCRFVKESSSNGGEDLFTQECSDDEVLDSAPARIMIFRPPK